MDIKNPDNLPVIEETSLHLITATVFLYKKYRSMLNQYGEIEGFKKFKEYIDLLEEGSLRKLAFFKYIQVKQNPILALYSGQTSIDLDEFLFKLIISPNGADYEDVGEYLDVKEVDDQVVCITSNKPFYWKEWVILSDTERSDWSKRLFKNNFVPDNDDFYENYKENYKLSKFQSNRGKPFVKYDYTIYLTNIVLGKIVDVADIESNSEFSVYCRYENKNGIIEASETYEPSLNTYFSRNISFAGSTIYNLNFSQCVFFSHLDFKSVLLQAKFEDGNTNSFTSSLFLSDTSFNSMISKECILYRSNNFVKNCKFECIYGSTFKISLIDNTFQSKMTVRNVLIFKSQNNIHYENIIFKDSELDENTYLNNIILGCTDLSVNFSNSTFEKKLFFSLKDDTKENYGKVTLNLYHASIQDFVCDDRNLGQVQLDLDIKHKEAKIDKLDQKDPKKFKDLTEQAIAERRVFRKILQDLNWGDLADLEYAKIMELQTDLEENGIKKWFSKKIFGWWLGWGVRVLPDFHTDSWSNFWKYFINDFKKGGIVLSSLLLFFGFAVILQIDRFIKYLESVSGIIFYRQNLFILTQQTPNPDKNWFVNLINLVFSSNADTTLQTFVVIFGFVQTTLILVILARKFMRM